jgi:hypothetical protein
MSIRKRVAQIGVILYILWTTAPFVFYLVPGPLTLLVIMVLSSGVFVLFIAALLPSRKEEEWGCIWPLAGYDNAIDAIYTRGPWLMRFGELEEIDRERGVSTGMTTLFGEDGLSMAEGSAKSR